MRGQQSNLYLINKAEKFSAEKYPSPLRVVESAGETCFPQFPHFSRAELCCCRRCLFALTRRRRTTLAAAAAGPNPRSKSTYKSVSLSGGRTRPIMSAALPPPRRRLLPLRPSVHPLFHSSSRPEFSAPLRSYSSSLCIAPFKSESEILSCGGPIRSYPRLFMRGRSKENIRHGRFTSKC